MRAIGFHHHQETLIKEDTPQLRGMLQQVRHLVDVVDEGGAARTAKATPKTKAKTKAKPKADAPQAGEATGASE